jgi:D-arginine dehydrogenase
VQSAEIIVIGAGIAGASAAAELAADAPVVLLEMEAQPGYHASGRSAAYFAAAYGKKPVRDITACCESFLREPPEGFSEIPLFHPRDCMFFGRADQAGSLRAMQEDNPRMPCCRLTCGNSGPAAGDCGPVIAWIRCSGAAGAG